MGFCVSGDIIGSTLFRLKGSMILVYIRTRSGVTWIKSANTMQAIISARFLARPISAIMSYIVTFLQKDLNSSLNLKLTFLQ